MRGCTLFQGCLGLFLAAACQVAHAQETPAPTAAPATPKPADFSQVTTVPQGLEFYSSRSVLWLGRNTVLPIHVAHPAPADFTFAVAPTAFGVVEILQPAVILANQSTGYLRLRGILPGRTRLCVQGGPSIDLEVKPDPAAATLTRIDPESGRPRIISPCAGAAVWGDFAVGVEVYDRFARAPGADGALPANGIRVQLRLPDGRMLDPVEQSSLDLGPERHCQFNVRAADLPPGNARLVAVTWPAAFTDVDRRLQRPGMIMESDPLVVSTYVPPADSILSGECEAPEIMGNSKELLAPAHPIIQGVYGPKIPEVRPDVAASGGKMVACPGSDTAWSLPVNIQQPGLYQLFVRARGDFACGAWPSLALYLGSADTAAGTVRLSSSHYERVPVGEPVRLESGPRMMTVAYRNDFNQGKEDRNLYLDRWELARVGNLPPEPVKENKKPPLPAAPSLAGNATVDLSARPPAFPALAPLPPTADVLYPPERANIYGVDAAVAKLSEGTGPAAWVDLLVDGLPQGERIQGTILAGGQPLLFPLLARSLPPGPHHVAIRVADATSGQTADSPARLIQVLAQPPGVPGQYARAVFLLDRLAFGPEPRELAALLTQGENAWLAQRLGSSFEAPAEQALYRAACKQFPQVNNEGHAINRALYQWLGTENPVRARFTAWSENHFSTWITKTETDWKWREHLNFCRLGIAPFPDLLAASAHSPAMLKYLDQEKSYAGKLNENYAREIMELHTLGVHGGYSQADVTALAGVLNGWTTTRECILPQEDDSQALTMAGGNNGSMESTFHFDPLMNDGKERQVFGLRFPATKDAGERHDHIALAMEMLASHPSTALHVCRKLAEHYVGVPASDKLVLALADTFMASGGDMQAVLRTMVAHPEFWQAPPRLATPFDFGLRVTRLCHSTLPPAEAAHDLDNRPGQLEGFLKKSGMGLFDRVTPDGYPDDGSNYADSNALLQRWRFMQTLNDPLNRLVPNGWRTPPAVPDRAVNDAAVAPPAPVDASQRFIDLAAARLTGHLLAPSSNEAAREVLGAGTPDQMHAALVFIALLPETSLR